MKLSRQLENWVGAQLIDAETAARIAAYEDQEGQPKLRMAVIGLGGLAVALGILLLIAANWDQIPDDLKIGVHLTLTLAAGVVIAWAARRDDVWVGEAALVIFAALILGGFSLHAQIFQLTGALWKLLLLWFVTTGPLLFVAGRTRITSLLFSGMAVWAAVSWLNESLGHETGTLLLQGLVIGVPWLLLALAHAFRAHDDFGEGTTEAGLLLILGGASFAHLAWAGEVGADDVRYMWIRLAVTGAAVLVTLWLTRRSPVIPPRLRLPLLAAPFLAILLAGAVPHDDAWGYRLIGAIIFAIMWGWIAWASALTGWRWLFMLAMAALAIRLFIIYFELFGSLAMTGQGLIVAGLLLIGLALGWQKIVTRLAPRRPPS